MSLKTISAGEIANRGVLPLADVPGLESNEMKRKFEEVVREVVIPVLNENAGNTYDKPEVDALLRGVVFEAQLADMKQSVYDTAGRGMDVYAYADGVGQNAVQSAVGKLVSGGDQMLYVTTKGKDSTGNGTAEAPFRTVKRALESLPPVIQHVVVIEMGAGSFRENVTVAGFSGGGQILIRGAESTQPTSTGTNLTGVQVLGCGCMVSLMNLYIANAYADYEADVIGMACTALNMSNCTLAGARSVGVQYECSSGRVYTTQISGKTYAISAKAGSTIAAMGNSGSGNTYCFQPHEGVIIASGSRPAAGAVRDGTAFELIT